MAEMSSAEALASWSCSRTNSRSKGKSLQTLLDGQELAAAQRLKATCGKRRRRLR